MGPRSLDVRPTFRKRRLWPWVTAAVVLVAVGVGELLMRRHAPARGSPIPLAGGPRATPAPPAPGVSPPPPRPEARVGAVTGRVLTRDGRPAPGVTVVVASSGLETATGDDGRFRLEVVEGASVRLEAHHSDLGFASAEVRAPASDLDLRLEPRASVEVQVLSEGRPVPGVEVTVQQRSGERALFHADRTTDPSGTLRFAGLPAGALEVQVWLEETGARAALPVEAREGTFARVTFLLPALGVIRGTVVTRSGAPVPGAFVGVEDAEGVPARSCDDGSFVLKGLRPGRDHRLTARTPDLLLDVPVSARVGQSEVRLVVRERPVFRGRVVGPSGAPVRAFSVDGRSFETEDGRFGVPLEPRGGQVELRVGATGMLTRTVRAGATVSELGDIPLQPAPRLEGRVKLASGRPAADAEVGSGPDTTRSDASGAFTLPISEPPPVGTPIVVHALQGELAGSVEASLGTPVEIVLGGEQPVRLRVFGPAGVPAPGRTVQLAGVRSYSWSTGPDGTVGGKALAGDYRASTDAQPGRVWFVRLPAAEVVLGGAAAAGSASLEVDLDGPVEALWVEKGTVAGPGPSERPGPRGEGQLLFGVERSARFDGLSAGTWTVVGLRQGRAVVRTVQVSGPTRLSL